MSSIVLAIILQVLGIAVIIAEFVLPSGGVLSIVALAVLGYSLFEVFAKVGPGAGMIFVLADVILIPVLTIVGIKILARSPIALRRALSRASGVSSQDDTFDQLVGKRGVTKTDLRPAGKAVVDGQRLDVVSAGDFIANNSPVVVSMVNGNRVVVRQATAKEQQSAAPDPREKETNG